MVHSTVSMLGQWCCSWFVALAKVILERLNPSLAWGVPVQGGMKIAVIFHVLGRRHQEFTLSTWHVGFIIHFSSWTQFGLLCAGSLSREWQPTVDQTLRVRGSCQNKCNCCWSLGAASALCGSCLMLLTPHWIGRSRKLYSALSICMNASASDLCLVRC